MLSMLKVPGSIIIKWIWEKFQSASEFSRLFWVLSTYYVDYAWVGIRQLQCADQGLRAKCLAKGHLASFWHDDIENWAFMVHNSGHQLVQSNPGNFKLSLFITNCFGDHIWVSGDSSHKCIAQKDDGWSPGLLVKHLNCWSEAWIKLLPLPLGLF